MLANMGYDSSYIKRGFLSKKGRGKLFRPWALRSFVLDSKLCRLYYYDGPTLKGDINLKGTTIRSLAPSEADGRSYAFEIGGITGDEDKSPVLVLVAGSYSEASDWIEAISSAAITATTSSTTSKHVYESFENIDQSVPIQPVHDAQYYKSLRAKNAEEKQRRQSSLQSNSSHDISSMDNQTASYQTEKTVETGDMES